MRKGYRTKYPMKGTGIGDESVEKEKKKNNRTGKWQHGEDRLCYYIWGKVQRTTKGGCCIPPISSSASSLFLRGELKAENPIQ